MKRGKVDPTYADTLGRRGEDFQSRTSGNPNTVSADNFTFPAQPSRKFSTVF
jgi:hypothetical protein